MRPKEDMSLKAIQDWGSVLWQEQACFEDDWIFDSGCGHYFANDELKFSSF